MPNITDKRVENYLYAMLPEREPVLQEMERQAKERDIPIVGPAVGRLFYQYARLINAKAVFELGSAIGYSTIWWATAVGTGGKVHYTDGSRKNADEARRYFDQAGVADRIQVHVGDALEVLSERKEEFDIVFNDVDKHDYPRVFNMAAARVRKGGLFITDNTLWSGKVAYAAGNPDLAKPTERERETEGVVELNRLLYSSKDWFTTIVPLRDGVAVALRL
jgi:caffeoyl-CoA O-methyltransferase